MRDGHSDPASAYACEPEQACAVGQYGIPSFDDHHAGLIQRQARAVVQHYPRQRDIAFCALRTARIAHNYAHQCGQ